MQAGKTKHLISTNPQQDSFGGVSCGALRKTLSTCCISINSPVTGIKRDIFASLMIWVHWGCLQRQTLWDCASFPQIFYDTETLDLGVVVYSSYPEQEGGWQEIPGQPDPLKEFQVIQGFIDRHDLKYVFGLKHQKLIKQKIRLKTKLNRASKQIWQNHN